MQRWRRAGGCSLGKSSGPAHITPPPRLRPIRALRLGAPDFPRPRPPRGTARGVRLAGGALPRPRGVRLSANPVARSLPVLDNGSGSQCRRRCGSRDTLQGFSKLHTVRASRCARNAAVFSPRPVDESARPPLCARDGPLSLLREILSSKGPVCFREVKLASVQRQRSGWMRKSHRVHAQDSSRTFNS